MRVLIAPDSFGGTLSAPQAAAAIAAGWRDVHPDHVVDERPLSDGGEGLLEVVAGPDDRWCTTEVAGPLGHPLEAAWLLRPDGTAVVETARACGLALVPEHRRDPALTTTYGVGQLLDAARTAGAERVLVGLGGSATVDGGAGALLGLGYRLRVADGSGLKIGGGDLGRVTAAEHGWAADWSGVAVTLLADVTTALVDAPQRFGPQKGASPAQVAELTASVARWGQVAVRDLGGGRDLRAAPGSGAAGGLGFALATALGATLVPGAEAVAALVGLATALRTADVVVTGEGRLDATSSDGKVVAALVAAAAAAGLPVLAVVGQDAGGGPPLHDLEPAAPDGPGDDPGGEVRAAAARLAARAR